MNICVWEYDKTNKDLIKEIIDAFDWVKDILSNFIPNQNMIFNDRESRHSLIEKLEIDKIKK